MTATDNEGLTPPELLSRPHPDHSHLPEAHNPSHPFSVEALLQQARLESAARLRNYAAGAMPSCLDTPEAIRAASPSSFPEPKLPSCYEERPWSPTVNRFFPRDFRQVVLMLLCHSRRGPPNDSELTTAASLPVEVWTQILLHTHRDWLLVGRSASKYLPDPVISIT